PHTRAATPKRGFGASGNHCSSVKNLTPCTRSAGQALSTRNASITSRRARTSTLTPVLMPAKILSPRWTVGPRRPGWAGGPSAGGRSLVCTGGRRSLGADDRAGLVQDRRRHRRVVQALGQLLPVGEHPVG